MKMNFLFTTILTFFLFSMLEIQAQTSLYYQEYPSSQPWTASDPLDLQRAMNYWQSCEGESSGTDKVYKVIQGGYYAATQISPSSNCEVFSLGAGGKGLNGHYSKYTGSTTTSSGNFTVDKDKNIVVSLNDGKKLLIITDQLMSGILVVRQL